MPWPAFNELGDLPVGVHRAMLAEVIAHLGSGTVQRVTITARLERIYELPRQTNAVQRCIIFGSDITTEPNPQDVDIFLVMQGTFPTGRRTARSPWALPTGPAPHKWGASLVWVNARTSFADTEDLIIGWQTRRDVQRRGIVEVVEHDRE